MLHHLTQVEITVNGEPTSLQMKVGEAGEAFFVVRTESWVPSEYATSPIPTPSEPAEEVILGSHIHPIARTLSTRLYSSRHDNPVIRWYHIS
jgi:hypothetical protein